MIDKSHIEHLAKLAKLDVTEEEKIKFSEQISAILSYIRQLDEVATGDVKPVDHITGLLNVKQTDEAREIFSVEKTLAAAPEVSKNQIKVKAVFDRE